MEKKNALVIGGTSGLGLELSLFLTERYNVYVTGRKKPQVHTITFKELELSDKELSSKLNSLISELPNIDLFVYAAGFGQDGTISDLTDEEILKMNYVGLIAPEMILQRILKKQGKLDFFIAITSSSQSKPREREPAYTAVKAGLGMLANSISLDARVKKTLVVAPGGMKTKFWDGTNRKVEEFLEPKWVAEQIIKLHNGEFKYKLVYILREPKRIEEVEKR